MTGPTFYLGTAQVVWLGRTSVPLFISRRRFDQLKSYPRAEGPWALDSGGFTELHKYGGWRLSAVDYAEKVRRYAEDVGRLEWVAPQDWMCERSALTATGLTVAEHQRLTVENFLELRQLLGDVVVPVLQGWELADYLDHAEQYERSGVDLEAERLVGVGSICRRDADAAIAALLGVLHPIRLHAFGVKGAALVANADRLASADSMAWSWQARHSAPLSGHSHRSCNNCLDYALRWRDKTLRSLNQLRLPLDIGGER